MKRKTLVHDGQTKWYRSEVVTVCGMILPKKHVTWPWFRKVNCANCLETSMGNRVGRPVIGVLK